MSVDANADTITLSRRDADTILAWMREHVGNAYMAALLDTLLKQSPRSEVGESIVAALAIGYHAGRAAAAPKQDPNP